MITLLTNRFVHYAFAGAIIFFLWKGLQAERRENKRVTNNFEVLQAEQDSAQTKIKALELTKNEFKEYYLEREDSLLKELKIKPKEILSIQYIKTIDKDTISVPINSDTLNNGIDSVFIKHTSFTKIGCSIVSFTWNNIEPTGKFDYEIKTDIKIIEHTERKKLLGKKWLPRWGRKEIFIQVIDGCSNSIMIQNQKINVDNGR